MRNTLASLLKEPKAAHPPERVWRDWLVIVVSWVAVVTEAVLRDDFVWAPASAVVCIVLSFTLLERRRQPFTMLAIAIGGFHILSALGWLVTRQGIDVYTGVFLLILVYSLFRWGSGREMARGSGLLLAVYVVSQITSFTGIGDAIGGIIVLFVAGELGFLVRNWGVSRQQKVATIKAQEREQLARELHDTVAHHLSAIAIQAQAGRFLAESSSPEGAIDAFDVIEEEASRSLVEMRSIIGALRDSDTSTAVTSQFRIADIEALAASPVPNAPEIVVERSGELDDLRPSVEAALYRLTQESITNARRHARNVSRIVVALSADNTQVRLVVSDDGDTGSGGASEIYRHMWEDRFDRMGTFVDVGSSGYGLVGMAERASLLGGTFRAGPASDGGWMVEVVLPRQG